MGGIEVEWVEVAYLFAAIVPSIIFHEVSHGVVALWFGDDTAQRAGRLTLNPIKHVDPFGTVILPLLLSLGGLGTFGYAKPVPVNVRRLRHPRQHSLYVSLAGPFTNIVLAIVGIVVFRIARPDTVFLVDGMPHDVSVIVRFAFVLGFVNTLLAVFNLLPIPPLDGSAMIERVLPHSWWPTWLRFRQYGFGVLLLLMFVIPGALNRVFEPALDLWFDLLA